MGKKKKAKQPNKAAAKAKRKASESELVAKAWAGIDRRLSALVKATTEMFKIVDRLEAKLDAIITAGAVPYPTEGKAPAVEAFEDCPDND